MLGGERKKDRVLQTIAGYPQDPLFAMVTVSTADPAVNLGFQKPPISCV